MYIKLTIENNPDNTHTISARLTLPVFMSTPVGDTKMPEPIIEPTITVQPFTRLILALSVTSPPPSSAATFAGVSPFPLITEFLRKEFLRFNDSFSIFIDVQGWRLVASGHKEMLPMMAHSFRFSFYLLGQNIGIFVDL